MKFLFIPGNNSLSHVSKCVVLQNILNAIGHEGLIAAGIQHSPFLDSLGITHQNIPDIQETDHSPFPTIYWFKNPQNILNCIQSEVDLINAFKPNKILGVFRYTTKISAQITKVPYYSLVCGCIIPEFKDVLGFQKNDPGYFKQRENLKTFNQYASTKMNIALKTLGLNEINNVLELLKGKKTFLWDFPEFMPLKTNSDIVHVGPIAMDHWPYDDVDISKFLKIDKPLAVLAFGTCTNHLDMVQERMTKILINLGYKILVAGGGNDVPTGNKSSPPDRVSLNFAPLNSLFYHTSLVVTHGGQMTLFEALQHKVPIFVIPFQPEQDHNGLCLEQIGCGQRLVRHQPFRGNSSVYMDKFNSMSDEEISQKIESFMKRPDLMENLSKLSSSIKKYNGAETAAGLLEE